MRSLDQGAGLPVGLRNDQLRDSGWHEYRMCTEGDIGAVGPLFDMLPSQLDNPADRNSVEENECPGGTNIRRKACVLDTTLEKFNLFLFAVKIFRIS
jgi:hypothetical protein